MDSSLPLRNKNFDRQNKLSAQGALEYFFSTLYGVVYTFFVEMRRIRFPSMTWPHDVAKHDPDTRQQQF